MCNKKEIVKWKLSTGKHKLVDFTEAYKDVDFKKFDAHDSKESIRFVS